MKLMQVWIVCFVLFFAAAELYQWLQGITLPLPVFVIAGALLAVASNAQTLLQKQTVLPLQQSAQIDPSQPVPSAWVHTEALPVPVAASPRYYPGVQLPHLMPQSGRSISFTLPTPNRVSAAENLGKDRD